MFHSLALTAREYSPYEKHNKYLQAKQAPRPFIALILSQASLQVGASVMLGVGCTILKGINYCCSPYSHIQNNRRRT